MRVLQCINTHTHTGFVFLSSCGMRHSVTASQRHSEIASAPPAPSALLVCLPALSPPPLPASLPVCCWRRRGQNTSTVVTSRRRRSETKEEAAHSGIMCTAKGSSCTAIGLYALALVSIVCNAVLFFPAADVKYVKDGHITDEVKYLGGLIGGGLLVLVSALYIHMTGTSGRCSNRIGMFLSIILSAVGLVGALYSFFVAAIGLKRGPLCKATYIWETPFEKSQWEYLKHPGNWSTCTEPKSIVAFNTSLFSILLFTSFLQMVLLAVQMINGFIGGLCGTGNKELP